MNEREQAKQKLRRQISEGDYASTLAEDSEFKWYIDRRTRKAEQIKSDILSDAYVDDHNGYVRALATYRALVVDSNELAYLASRGNQARQQLKDILDEEG